MNLLTKQTALPVFKTGPVLKGPGRSRPSTGHRETGSHSQNGLDSHPAAPGPRADRRPRLCFLRCDFPKSAPRESRGFTAPRGPQWGCGGSPGLACDALRVWGLPGRMDISIPRASRSGTESKGSLKDCNERRAPAATARPRD